MRGRTDDRPHGPSGSGSGLNSALSDDRLPPARTLGELDERWARYHVTEKNTFLNIEAPLEESVGGMKLKFEHTSDPLPQSSSGASSSACTSRDSSAVRSTSSLEVLDSILFGADNVLFESDRSSRSVTEDDVGSAHTPRPHDGADMHDMSSDMPGGAKRWCKGKRRRHHALVERLKEAISNDPEGFDFETIGLPPSLNENPKAKSKLLSLLMAHRDDELQKQRAHASAAPAASSKQKAHASAAPAASSSSGTIVTDTRPRTRIPAPKKMSL